jgi:undecaprenyl-diphosphatase
VAIASRTMLTPSRTAGAPACARPHGNPSSLAEEPLHAPQTLRRGHGHRRRAALLALSRRAGLALATGTVLAAAFLVVAGEARPGSPTAFDRAASAWLHGLASPGLDAGMQVITFLGSVVAVAVVVAAVAVFAVRRRAPFLAGLLVAVACAAEGLNALLKLLFHRPRPDLLWRVTAAASYSFPSGHSMVSAAAYGMAAIVIGRLEPRRWPVHVVGWLLILLIGVSRVYLGMHWATDVIGGFAAGGLMLVAVDLALPRAHRAPATSASR